MIQLLLQKYFKQYWLVGVVLLYLFGFMYVFAYKRHMVYIYACVPMGLFIIYTALFHLQYLVFFLAFATPLSVTLKELGLTEGPDLSLPTEPVMMGIMLMYLLNHYARPLATKELRSHPVTIIIFVQVLWMLVTTFTSTDVVVSVKYLLARLWFIFSCYIIVPHLFKNKNNIVLFVFAYSAALAIVVIYTTLIHATYNFNEKAADWVVSPFYNDHTAYGAALAMFIPVLFSLLLVKFVDKGLKVIALILFIMFMVAIVLSFARAGWLSLAVALAILISIMLKIRFRTLFITVGTIAVIFLSFQTEILMTLERISTDSDGDFEDNVVSVVNISTDASNVERINRWSCALRMWEDRPLLGWGPGTYMFKYAPYQLSRELTIISTNFGTNGNAHSEYLGPLAEQGVLGLLLMLVMLLYVTSMGYRLMYSLKDRDSRILCGGLFLGIMTYFIHGFFNNFLDSDKLALPFWAFLAGLVTIDILHLKKDKTTA